MPLTRKNMFFHVFFLKKYSIFNDDPPAKKPLRIWGGGGLFSSIWGDNAKIGKIIPPYLEGMGG